MKQCRKCQREYADESLFFCLDDGTLLSKVDDPQATLQYPPRELRETLPYAPDTPAWTPAKRPNERKASSINPLHIPTIIASMLLVLVTGIALWFIVKSIRRDDVVVSHPTPSPPRVSSPAPTRTPTPIPPTSGNLPSQLVGKWKWDNWEAEFLANGTGSYWLSGKKCFDLTYYLEGDVLHYAASSKTTCGVTGAYRISISGDTLRQTSVKTDYVSDWKRQ